jgi:tRNA A-37 threonylcarbamoyl transferase component Bud32
MYRTDRASREAEELAKLQFLSVMTPLVNEWAASHKKALLTAEEIATNDTLIEATVQAKAAAKALAEAEDVVAKLVIHELQVRRELKA